MMSGLAAPDRRKASFFQTHHAADMGCWRVVAYYKFRSTPRIFYAGYRLKMAWNLPTFRFNTARHIDKTIENTYHEIYHCLKEINMLQTAKIFATGRSQAVRLPLAFRFDVSEVFIRHDPSTGDVVLSRKPSDWQGLLDAVALNAQEDLLIERRQAPAQPRRDPFEGWQE
jgi:antitoxin VapB